MKIILLEKVVNLGQLGDIVTVKDGYARNFLIPQKKAKRATVANLADFEQKRAEIEKQQAEILAQAQEVAGRLDGLMIQITRKAGVDGRLFGSVTTGDIAEAVQAQGFNVGKIQVRLPNGPLKGIGDHHIAIALHTDVIVDVTVSILGEH